MNYLIIEGQKRRASSPVWPETDLRKLKNILFVSLFSKFAVSYFFYYFLNKIIHV